MTRSASATRTAWSRWSVEVRESFTGQPLCLALANTRNWRRGDAPLERLQSYADVVAFARRERLVDDAGAARLDSQALRHPRVAEAELVALVALREAIFRGFAARAAGGRMVEADLTIVTGSFNAAVGALSLELRDGALVPRSQEARDGLPLVRLQSAVSAVALLTAAHADKVRECADDRGCGWLFVDLTRNGSRRYCFSNECGNRARQAAFRARHRADAGAAGAG
jgi:predicted RNA-binding Zn ribbon-like protein